jgi:hypothetical protein
MDTESNGADKPEERAFAHPERRGFVCERRPNQGHDLMKDGGYTPSCVRERQLDVQRPRRPDFLGCGPTVLTMMMPEEGNASWDNGRE